DGKVSQLDRLYPHLKTEEAAATDTIAAPVEHLDLATVIAVSQTVSSEMKLEKLVEALMRAAIEHAGAERAVLFLSQEAGLRMAAEAVTGTDAIIVQVRDEPTSGSALPETILRYVAQTQDSVTLDDAAKLNLFSSDSHLANGHVRSVLC